MSEEKSSAPNVYTFKDERTPQDPFLDYTPSIRNGKIPLVIDNGAYQCRAGWATAETPLLTFKNLTAKQRGKKESEILVGNEINNVEAVRLQLRTQFDRNLVTFYDAQEQIFDYLFSHLSINTEGCVDHPIVMTEPVANPNYCRQQMSELLFECYHVPQVAYGIDSLFSLMKNCPSQKNAMVVDCGYQTTHILSVLNGRLDTVNCRRINMGGAHLDSFMQKLLQLKYPGHMNAVTVSRAEELIRDHTYMAVDYLPELHEWVSDDYYDENVHKIQLPFTNAPGSQISAQQQKERREQQIKRLKEVNMKKRQERLVSEEETLQRLMRVQELMTEDDEEAFSRALEEVECDDAEELESLISKTSANLQRLKAKILGIEPPQEDVEPKKQSAFHLLDIPDDQLTPDDLVTKKRQKILMKAREGREKAQAVQREKRQKEQEEEKKLEERRLTDFTGWLQEVREKRQKLLELRTAKRQKKSNMAKRKTMASMQRMKIISQLAGNTKKEDTFGQDDKDWDVYKEINPDTDSDSEAEEDKLEELETMLREHDPEYQKELDESAGIEKFDIAEYYRLHLAVERIRVPELLFQPSMIGLEQAGIAETMDYVFKKYPLDKQDVIAQYVFVTGGNCNFTGFKERMDRELLAMRPFQSTFSVHVAANPSLDAWLGAKQWALSPTFSASYITRADYEEKGGEYLREHCASNRYVPTPVLAPK